MQIVNQLKTSKADSLPVAADRDLHSFLRSQKNSFLSIDDRVQGVTIDLFLGNESADLDSLATTITASYLFEQNNRGSFSVPVLNMKRSDYQTKQDLVLVANSCGFSIDDLIFIEDIERCAVSKNIRLHLVDHNCLTKKQSYWQDNVVEIIDHHQDSGRYADSDPQLHFGKTISSVGSCSTLISERVEHPELLPESVRLLIAHTICLDTAGFTAQHTSERDRCEFDRILVGSKYDVSILCPILQQARADISGLTFSQILLKDIKYYDGYWLASIPSGVDYGALVISHESFRALESELEKVKFGMVFSWQGDQRMLSIYALPPSDREKLKESFRKHGVVLTSIPIEDGGTHYTLAPKWNRKTLQPIIDAALKV